MKPPLKARPIITLAASGAVLGLALSRLAAELWPGRFYLGYTLPGATLAALLGVGSLFIVSWAVQLLTRRPWRQTGQRMWPWLLMAPYLLAPVPAPLAGASLAALALGTTAYALSDRKLNGALFGLSTCLAAFLIYLATLLPSVLPGDSGEFQLAPYVLGVPHPTGYPLWIWLGRLMTLLPLHSVAWRLNLLSAIAGSLAVLGVWLSAQALGVRPSAACLAALAFAVTATMWEQSVQAEKYALNAAFVTLITWLLLEWRRTGRGTWLNLFALAYGISLTHHRTMLLLAPAYALLIVLTDRTVVRPRRVLALAGLWALPLSLYLTLPLLSSRNPPLNFLQPNTLSRFWAVVFAREYQGNFFALGWSAMWPQLGQLAETVSRQFTPAGLGLALLGLVWLAVRNRPGLGFFLTAWVVQIGFTLNYNVPNNYVYYLPTYALLALAMAVGLETVLSGPFWRVLQLQTLSQAALVMLLGLLPLSLGEKNLGGRESQHVYPSLDVNQEYVVTALNSVSGPAYIVSDWLSATALWYGQSVLGLAPQAVIVVADPLENIWHQQAQDGFGQGRPVYLSRPIIGASKDYVLDSAGPLVRLIPPAAARSTTTPPAAWLVPAAGVVTFGGQAQLLGFSAAAIDPLDDGALRPRPFAGGEAFNLKGGETLEITLYWQALQTMTEDAAVSLTLVDEQGKTWGQVIGQPVGQAYATSDWLPGRPIADYHRLPIDPFTPTGNYSLRLSLGPVGQESGWPVQGRGLALPGQMEVLRVHVEKPLQPSLPDLQQARLANFGGKLLLRGAEIPEQAAPGDLVQISTYWQALMELNTPITVTLHLGGASEGSFEITPPAGGWRRGEIFRCQSTLPVPAQLKPGDQPLQLQLAEAGGQPVEVQAGWAQLPAARLALSRLAVEASPALANFGGLISLRQFKLDQASYKPGDLVHLTLDWQALKKIDQDYKVFVHIVTADEWIITQQDNQPVNNTYPTSRWSPGERVADAYTLQIPTDAAPGTYRIAVGLYLPTSLTRLSKLGADGQITGDRAILTTIVVQ